MFQSVTALCQAGKLETAYQQASAALAERPDSQFAQNDMYAVVLACLKKYVGQADAAATARWVRKLAALHLPAQAWRDEQVCWEIRNLLHALSKRQYPPHAEVAGLLRDLLALPLVPVASVGRSRLLQAALKFKEQLPTEWWTWWNLELLRAEDFEKESFVPTGADKAIRMPALAESAYGAYAKSLLKQLTTRADATIVAEVEALLPCLEALANEHPDYSWLGYHRAKLLVALGDTAAAMPTLLRIVRQKSTEYWAWQLLGETLRPTDAPAALACYYRAAQCSTDDIYLGRLRETLADMMHGAGYLGEAQQQLQRFTLAKQAEGKPLPNAARYLANQDWFTQTYVLDKAVTSALLANAEAAAYGDLPWQPVVMQYVGEELNGKPAMVKLLPTAARPLQVPLKRYKWLERLKPGTPLQIKSEEVAGRLKVIQLQKRPEGQPWDVLPAQIAVITGVLPDQSRAFFTVQPGLSGAMSLADFKLQNLHPGDTFQIRLQSREKEGVMRHRVLAAERTTATAAPSVCRDFSGKLRLHEKGFGFADNIFLPAQLITQRGWVEGDEVSGRAVLSHNRLKGKDEWSAAKVN